MSEATAPSIRQAARALAASQGLLFACLGLARWATFHNETFDLAFYTRIAWGFVHFEFWDPIVNAHFYGLHLSVILAPLGALGFLFHTPPVLIVAQACALALASIPLSAIGERYLGPPGTIVGALAWLYFPNLGHVAGYEVHPGAMAALPLSWMAWSIVSGERRTLIWAGLLTLLSREDLALVTTLAAAVFAWRHREHTRAAAIVGGVSVAYALVFFLVLHPMFAPPRGSLQLHFGRFGNSAVQVAIYLLTHPVELLAHLAAPQRLTYLPKILVPFALLPLRRPSWLIPTLPILAINLISEWPTTTSIEVHYLTPALPFLVAGALEGASLIPARRFAIAALVLGTLIAHALAGGTPLAIDFPSASFAPDDTTRAGRAIVAAIPDDASVQAPDPLLSHLAERSLVRRAASAEAGADFLVLDVSHRRRFAGREDLLRTIEEPPTRAWLARDDHRVLRAVGDYVLLARGGSPRTGLGGRAIIGRADPSAGARIAACLAVLEAKIEGDLLLVDFVASGSCPNDLALRIGTTERPRRVDLLFGGLLSPVHLQRGDRARSMHRLAPSEIAGIRRDGLRIGALRSSGARPDHEDPFSVAVAITR